MSAFERVVGGEEVEEESASEDEGEAESESEIEDMEDVESVCRLMVLYYLQIQKKYMLDKSE